MRRGSKSSLPSFCSKVVGAKKPEQPQDERIRQNRQEQTSNICNERTPIFKTKEQNDEIDELIDEINNSDINTAISQRNDYKPFLTDENFYRQYVVEMRQKRGPSLMTSVVQEPLILEKNSEINYSRRRCVDAFAELQNLNYMTISLKHAFKYLKFNELLTASQVCVAWNNIANNEQLWHNVSLKNYLVRDWEKCMDKLCRQQTVVLDTRHMLIPDKDEEREYFWSEFTLALPKALYLKCIELYRCPVSVVEQVIYSSPQLTVLNATSLENPCTSKNPDDLMVLNLNYLDQMVQLTELRLKGMTGIKLTNLPSFEILVNLKTLSLTSVKEFSKDVNHSLETVTTNLAFLEIGDCEFLNIEFAMIIKRFTNLTSLRLENCIGEWNSIAEKVFCSIQYLKKLKILELVNINFAHEVVNGLEKLDGIKELLIIPDNINQCITVNCNPIDCLKKLSKTLTHFVWGITDEMVTVTDVFLSIFNEKYFSSGSVPEKNSTFQETKSKEENPDNVVKISIPALKNALQKILKNAKIDIVVVDFADPTQVYSIKHFKDF